MCRLSAYNLKQTAVRGTAQHSSQKLKEGTSEHTLLPENPGPPSIYITRIPPLHPTSGAPSLLTNTPAKHNLLAP